MSKKGLVLVYDPHNLLQFIWYYCTYAKDKKWDALCFPNGDKGEYMSQYCKKSEIFENVFSNDKEFLNAPLAEQLKIFLKMTAYASVRKQEQFAEKMLSQYINLNDYDEVVVLADFGIISGLFIALSKKKKTIILEDGTADYYIRNNSNLIKNIKNPADWKGFLLANMGYANVGHRYPLKSTKNCIKFSSHPESMPYKEYKEHNVIFEFSKTDMELYNSILAKVYEKINSYDFNKYDTVLFTNSLKDFINDDKEYVDKTVEYVSSVGHSVLIKKHPRDMTEYKFSNDTIVDELDQSIPAEVILPYLVNKKIIFMQATSIMLYIDSSKYDCQCLYYNDLLEKSKNQITYFDYVTELELKNRIDTYQCKEITIKEV